MPSKKQSIIGLVGLPGSGKTTVAKILQKKGYETVILSSFISNELDKLGLSINRKNLQDVGDRMRKEGGSDILARLALAQIKKQKIHLAIIDGIRNLAEVKRLKKEKDFKLIGVSATPDKRFVRLTKNNDKYNNINNWQDFIHYELREDAGTKKEFGQQNRLCYLHADSFIANNSTLKGLERSVVKILN